ncbi:protein phosphatase 2C domain-containing protein [Streptacidiphilus melanogenes]|uniref:protein phosphatase 2C domain-containing protein n=1 Tax=Streptacidiphilus melanogenes TaxID=411235 RepID=UPI0005AA243B|nr:protein phosphatase 2C domain-containing protein [Streptacidiphilus melanogenes]
MNAIGYTAVAILTVLLATGIYLLARQRAVASGLARQLATANTLTTRLSGELDTERTARAVETERAERLVLEKSGLSEELELVTEQRQQQRGRAEELAARLAEHDDVLPPELETAAPTVPRSLPIGREAAPDSVVDGADLGPVVVRAASVRGSRHREDREQRRDAVNLRLVDGFGAPVLLSTVAAGAAQAPLSQTGADAACRALATRLAAGALASGVAVFARNRDAALEAALRSALAGAAESVRLVARANAVDSGAADPDRQAGTSVFALISQLGDLDERQHVLFGAGDAVLLGLRAGGSGPDAGAAWETLFEPDPGLRGALLPGRSGESAELQWARVTTRPGDLLVLASRPMAELLRAPGAGAWFARRWRTRRPHLITFLSDVNANIRSADGDRTVACVWDHGRTH